jgi:ATP-dependent helicase/nuclease subunit A
MSADPSLAHRDREARLLAQREFVRPLVLEAGAGTGKTTALVARLLVWGLGPGWERAAGVVAEERRRRGLPGEPDPARVAARVWEGVAAITFTEAAAAQMGERLAGELRHLAAGSAPPPWLELPAGLPVDPRAAHLLTAIDRLVVSTIHAFCLRLLARFPLEAGLHPSPTVDADGRLVEEAVAEVLEGHLARAYGPRPDPAFLTLASRGRGPAALAEALALLVREEVPVAALRDEAWSAAELARTATALTAAVGRLRPALAPLLADPRGRTVQALAEGLDRLADLAASPPAHWRDLLAALPTVLGDGARKRLEAYARGSFSTQAEQALDAAHREELAAAAAALAQPLRALDGADPELYDAARSALADLLAAVRERLRTQGVLTFQALLTGAVALLEDHPAVAAAVRGGLDQLLVDEFQDTDALQCRLIAVLALQAPAGERPGLFVVGDPKQSIFGWRSADLAAYEALVRRVTGAGGAVAPLAVNFRSRPAILAEVERLVAPVMRPEPGAQPRFEPLLPSRPEPTAPLPGDARTLEHWISWRLPGDGVARALAETRSGDADEVEAAAIAADVARLAGSGLPLSEVALLFRSLTSVEPYLDALRRAGIPFAIRGDRQYYRRREVIEAAALARAVLDPADHLALVTLLRSAWVGVPDAALLPLWRRQLPRRFTELGDTPEELTGALADLGRAVREAVAELPPGIPGLADLAGWEESLLAAAEALAAARRSWATEPVDTFVERLRELFLPEPLEAARYLGPYRVANLERFFRELTGLLEDSGGDVPFVLSRLRRSVFAVEAEEAQPAEDGAAVQVLTLHRAKGLEFDWVYLPQLHRESRPTGAPPTGAGRDAGGAWALRLLGAAGPRWHQVEDARERLEAAERVRLLYVAVTRARERLVLLGRFPAQRAAVDPRRARTLLELVGHRRGEPPAADLEAWFHELAERGAWGAPDATGARWGFPALRWSEPPEPSVIADPAPGPDPAAVARDAQELRRRREAAAVIAARPFSRPASEEAHHRLAELAAEGALDPRREVPAELREHRLAVGTALHRALELLDPAAPPAAEAARLAELLAGEITVGLPPDLAPAAVEDALAVWHRFTTGPLFPRLRQVGAGILGREVPVLLPPGEDTAGFVAGSIDLLYRDSGDGGVVVADYKTDRVEDPQELIRRAAAYAPQGTFYARAIQGSLDLPTPPRFELWFLWAGVVVKG